MIEVLQAKIKKSWDIKMEKQVLEARDLVMMYNSRLFCRIHKKLLPKWLGPYKIKEILWMTVFIFNAPSMEQIIQIELIMTS